MLENLKADINRFVEVDPKNRLRAVISGIASPGFQAIAMHRLFHFCHRYRIPTQPFRYALERMIEIMTGISIPARCKIGKGFRIHHFGGIIFHPTAELGDHCTIYHEVTIGDRGGYGNAAKIGDNVLIGAGAKIIGDIVIEQNCKIGANAVVNKDMAEGTIAYGNPAHYKRLNRYKHDNG